MIFGYIGVCTFDAVFFMVYLFLVWYISGAQLSGAQFVTFSGQTVGPRGPTCHFSESHHIPSPLVEGKKGEIPLKMCGNFMR